MKTSALKLEWKLRQGGGGKTERKYLDFLIEDIPLLTHLASPESDFIARLGWVPAPDHNAGIDHLLLKSPPDSPSGRVLLLICPECGDLGCGAFSARITKDENSFIWSDFAFENNYENKPVEVYPEVGPFGFDKKQYFQELTHYRISG